MEQGFRGQGLVGERREDLVTRLGDDVVTEEGVQEQE